MSAKRFALACSAVVALMTAAAPAQSPELLPAPRPVVITPHEAPIMDSRTALVRFLDESDAREIERMRGSGLAGERQVVLRAICLMLPHGTVESLGRILADRPEPADAKPSSGPWAFTPREARMLAALLAVGPPVDILSRPQLTLDDDQTGFFQVGEQKPVLASLKVETKSGAEVYTAQVTTTDVGLTLRTTPKIAADGRSVRLRVEAQHSAIGGPVLPVVSASFVTDQGVVRRTAPVTQVGVTVNVQTIQTTVELPAGGTALVCCTETSERGQGRVVWLLTPHVIAGQPAPIPIPPTK